jgi:hypothetical protein
MTKIYKALTIPVSLTIKKYIVKHREKVATVSTINLNSSKTKVWERIYKGSAKSSKIQAQPGITSELYWLKITLGDNMKICSRMLCLLLMEIPFWLMITHKNRRKGKEMTISFIWLPLIKTACDFQYLSTTLNNYIVYLRHLQIIITHLWCYSSKPSTLKLEVN